MYMHCMCFNEMFVTVHVDDILNTVFRNCKIQYSYMVPNKPTEAPKCHGEKKYN